MPITVKLSTAEYRAWRVNKAQWVSPEGIVLRAVTPEEEKSLFPAVERTKAVGKTQSYPLVVTYRQEDPDSGQVVEQKTGMEATIRITMTGRERNNYVLDTFVNGCRYVKGREIIEKRMLATHGECNLLGPNGKRLRVIRNPAVRRPSFSESQRSAPHPDNCHCKGWKDHTNPGRHHAACEWNAKAPQSERALPFHAVVEPTLVDSPEPLESLAFDPRLLRRPSAPAERPRTGAFVVPTAPGTRKPDPTMMAPTYANVPKLTSPDAPIQVTKVPPTKPIAQVYSVADCPEDCRGARSLESAWRWPQGRRAEKGQHHPLCPHDAAFRQKQRGDESWMLYDLTRRSEVREATPDEVTRSELELQRSGTRSVNIAGTIFAVVQSGQASPAKQRRPQPVAEPASPSHVQAAEQRRSQALADSQLPGVPVQSGPPLSHEDDVSEIELLRARLHKLENRQSQVEFVPHELVSPRNMPIATAADHLRNELGLVGNQQATDDIPLGPVVLNEPEAFIDPVEHARKSRPAPYHPGAARPKGFVPPAPPGPPGSTRPTSATRAQVNAQIDAARAAEDAANDADLAIQQAASVAALDASEAEPELLGDGVDEDGADLGVDLGPDEDGHYAAGEEDLGIGDGTLPLSRPGSDPASAQLHGAP